MLRLFQDNFIFGEATFSHFFRVTTSTQQLHFRSRYFFRAAAFFSFFRTATFSEQLFFQNSFFFRTKILQSSHFLRMRSSLWQLLFSAVFPCLGSKKELLFQGRYFYTVSTFSEKLHFGKS